MIQKDLISNMRGLKKTQWVYKGCSSTLHLNAEPEIRKPKTVWKHQVLHFLYVVNQSGDFIGDYDALNKLVNTAWKLFHFYTICFGTMSHNLKQFKLNVTECGKECKRNIAKTKPFMQETSIEPPNFYIKRLWTRYNRT